MTAATPVRARTYYVVLIILGLTHFLNDLMQSLIPAAYPILRDAYSLDYVQIGLITLTFQLAGSLLQPVVGLVADRRPMPYSPVVGMMFTLAGLVGLAFDCQRVDAVPAEAHDAPLGEILSESGLRRFPLCL